MLSIIREAVMILGQCGENRTEVGAGRSKKIRRQNRRNQLPNIAVGCQFGCQIKIGFSVDAENPFYLSGDPPQTRTADSLIKSQVLYRLS